LNGNPFASVVAQDIMEPFPPTIDTDGGFHRSPDALRHLGVLAMPSVDRDGHLAGNATTDKSTEESQIEGVQDLAQPDTVSYDASFADIYEAFSAKGCPSLIVTDGSRPLGYLTCDGFLSLIDPIHAESFAHSDKHIDELAYLTVPTTGGKAAIANIATD
jgi:hypothetical protein